MDGGINARDYIFLSRSSSLEGGASFGSDGAGELHDWTNTANYARFKYNKSIKASPPPQMRQLTIVESAQKDLQREVQKMEEGRNAMRSLNGGTEENEVDLVSLSESLLHECVI